MTPYAGRILRIDLQKRTYQTQPLKEEWIRLFLGGRGINQWLLWQKLEPALTAFSPETPLIFGAGALTGTPAPGASRLSLDSLNPLTLGIGSSNVGGFFAAEMKFAGFDHVVITGRSETPVYLFIQDGRVEFRDASRIWGRNIRETEEVLSQEVGDDVETASIGVAGEKLVRFAHVSVKGSRAAGRCGLGAVMGYKNLKAVAVKGRGTVGVADPRRFLKAVLEKTGTIRQSPGSAMRRKYGTLGAFPLKNDLSGFPVRNFQDGYFDPEKMKGISPEAFHSYCTGHHACCSCVSHCGHFYSITDGPYAGTECNKLETNYLLDFGTRLDIDYAPAILKASELCNDYGMDVDSVSCTIGWAMECYQRGLISREEADGLDLTWGNHSAVMSLLPKIAYREGFGDLLAEGVKRAARKIGRGSEYYALEVKGLELKEGVRSVKGWALGIMVSPRGGTHTRGAILTETRKVPPEVAEKIWGVPTAGMAFVYEGKPELVFYYENLHAVLDALGVCFFTSNWQNPDLLSFDDLAELYTYASGRELEGKDLQRIGERMQNMEKVINILTAGFTRKDDYPPRRLMEEEISSGPGKGQRLAEADWSRMLDRYYEIHGWDRERGWPTRKKLQELGLGETLAKLAAAGKDLV